MTILVCFFSAADPVAVFFIDFFTQSSPPAKMRGNDDIWHISQGVTLGKEGAAHRYSLLVDEAD
jgi:hypothetical protein